MTVQDPDEAREYSTSFLSHAMPTELRRLRSLEQEFDPNTIRVLGGRGLDPAWRCLELGSGAGSIARWLAERCAHVVATDNDTTFLDDLRVPNLRVQRHDVVTEDFPPGTFDLIHARLLLSHLPERDAVLAKAAGWLAPGGWLVTEDFAWFSDDAMPYAAMQRAWNAAETYMARAIGTDVRWAPRLGMLMAGAGLVDVGMSVDVRVSDSDQRSDAVRLTLNQLSPALVAEGLLTEAEAAAAMALLDDPSYVAISFAIVSAWGRRPPPS